MSESSFNYVHVRDAADLLDELDTLLGRRMAQLEDRAPGAGVHDAYASTRHVRESVDVIRRALELLEADVVRLRPVWDAIEAGGDLVAAKDSPT